MKVLICTGIFPPEIGGPATYAGLLAQELPKRGFSVEIFPFREVRGYPRGIRHLMYFFGVFRRGFFADVIFTQDPVSTGVPVVCAAFLIRKRVVLRVAGDYAWEQARQHFAVTDSIDEFQNKKYSFFVELLRKLQTFSVRYSHRVITPSNYFNKVVSSWLWGGVEDIARKNIRDKNITTIYNGIDIHENFKKESKFSQKTIISAGRLVPWKGFDVLIEALSKMPDWQLLIAGEGPDKGRLVEIVSKHKLEDRVNFLGKLDRADLFSKIYRSHVFALLSTFESFSFQVVEAMFVGTPVIAAKIGNLGEIIENEVNGILLEPRDIDSFIRYSKKIVEDDSYRGKIINAASIRAADFSIDKTIDQLSKVLQESGRRKDGKSIEKSK